MLVYIAIISIALTIFFDLSRIASLGALYYLVLDTIFQWGVLRRIKETICAHAPLVITSLIVDIIVTLTFLLYKIMTALIIVIIAAINIPLIFIREYFFLKYKSSDEKKYVKTEK